MFRLGALFSSPVEFAWQSLRQLRFLCLSSAASTNALPSGKREKQQDMPRADLYLKVELDIDEDEKPERLAAEICRMLRKVYGVRTAEVSSLIERPD